MNTWFLYAAAFVSGVTTLAHVVIGGKKNAAPVLGMPGLPTGPRVTVEFTWHAASVFLLFITIIYLLAAVRNAGCTMVTLATVQCGVLGILGFFVAYKGGVAPWTFPPALLFSAIAVFGGLALKIQA